MSLDLERHLVAKANEAFQPLTANFELTPVCNFNCEMCFIRMSRHETEAYGGIQSADRWIAIASQLQQMGTLFILLTGGEPMLHPEFDRIYTTLRSMGFIMTLNTNGTMITEKMCRETFKEKPRRMNVTLYGTNPDTYERLTHNRNGFEQTMRGLRLLRDYDIDTKINLSMLQINGEEYDQLMAIADELGFPVVSNSYMTPDRRKTCATPCHTLEARLSPQEAARLDNLFHRYKQAGEYPTYARNAVFKAEEGTPSDEGVTLSCRAGRSSMWIDWQHHITPCVMMEAPFVDLATGEAHSVTTPEALRRGMVDISDIHTPVSSQIVAGDIADAWQWLVHECLQLPSIDDCKGCRLKHICQVCYAAAIHEKQQYGSLGYLCKMAEGSLEYLKQPH